MLKCPQAPLFLNANVAMFKYQQYVHGLSRISMENSVAFHQSPAPELPSNFPCTVKSGTKALASRSGLQICAALSAMTRLILDGM